MLMRQCNFLKTTLSIVLLSCLSNSATSADRQQVEAKSNTAAQRPKIGLVLSGGGARGFAHIGVLKVLEENNVPIDYIVGTSMGSIIGGLYAIGLSPDEIEQGVESIAWDKVFSDFAYRQYKTFRRKQDDFDFFNIHRVGVSSDGLQLSPSLIEGQQIELALDRLAYPGFHINDYDDLRIPFRAVATNIENGEPFIIRSGNIARAMRASMSIPGALPPITIDGVLLVDGGIANNIPIDIVREMGADIVIVVDVSAPFTDQEHIKSSIDITGQLTTIMTRRIANQQLQTLTASDILIIPGEEEIASSDFDQYPLLIKAGESAATAELDNIKKLSLSNVSYSRYKAALASVANMAPVIDFIEIKNKTDLDDEILQVRIHQKIGMPLDVAQLEQDLSYIYGLDFSSSVVYSLENRDGETGLIVYVRDRDWAQSYLSFGLSIKSESDLGSFTNFDVAYNKNNLNRMAGEFRATAGVGSEPELGGEFYQPLNDELDIFVSAKAGLYTTVFPVVADNNVDSIQRFQRNTLSLSTGKIFQQNTELRISLTHNDGHTITLSGDDPSSYGDFTEGFIYTRLFHDSLDNLSFPNNGFFGGIAYKANRESLGSDANYDQIQLLLSGAGTYERYTVFSRAMLETTVDDDAPYNALYRHGGFMELSGTLDRELAGQYFGLIEAAFYRRLGNITFLPIYTGFSIEAGNAWNQYDEINSDNTRAAGSIFIGADTFMGPLYFAFGATDNGEKALYFNLGQTFLADF